MPEVGLTVACADYDRTRPILDGRVGIEGCRVIPVAIEPEDSFPRAVSRAEFDVSELSVSSYLLQHSRGECPYIAIPAFLSRSFRHDCYYVRADSGIRQPKDLEGRLVGVPEYQMTLALWGRGILQDEYGVDFRKLRYRTGGTNKPGRKERLPLRLPDHMDVKPIAADRSLNEMLLAGEIDAIMSPGPPKAFVDGHPNVQRLNPIRSGEDAKEMLTLALESEREAVTKFNAGAQECHDLGDHGTAAVFEEMVRDEERHADWFESQLQAMEVVGVAQYLSQQVDASAP